MQLLNVIFRIIFKFINPYSLCEKTTNNNEKETYFHVWLQSALCIPFYRFEIATYFILQVLWRFILEFTGKSITSCKLSVMMWWKLNDIHPKNIVLCFWNTIITPTPLKINKNKLKNNHQAINNAFKSYVWAPLKIAWNIDT